MQSTLHVLATRFTVVSYGISGSIRLKNVESNNNNKKMNENQKSLLWENINTRKVGHTMSIGISHSYAVI